MKGRSLAVLAAGLALGLLLGGAGVWTVQYWDGSRPSANSASSRAEHADKDGHDREHAAERSAGDEHAAPDEEHRHAEEQHAHEEGHEPGVVHLSPEKRAGLRLDAVEVRRGALTSVLELPGQVEWNTDRLVHVTPRVPGIVIAVHKTLGEQVRAGDELCVLDSQAMAAARMAYLAWLSRFEVAKAEMQRARAIFTNTGRLLEILDAAPAPDAALTQAHALEIGANKNRLLTAYTAMHVAQRTFERARALFEKGVGTEQDLLEAQGAYETARADYLSTREEIAFNLRPDFLRAERDFDVAEMELHNAERSLHILGLSNTQTQQLAARAAEIDEEISRNTLVSPADGVIVDRHLTRGELVDTDARLYTIADLSDVWVMGRVHERDIRALQVGQRATVRLDAFPRQHFDGAVDYIGSELDAATRTVEARVVLPNPDRLFRPGMFGSVTVFADAPADAAGLLVPVDALQRVPGGHVVFRILSDDEYRQVPVRVVAQSKELAEVSGALEPGMAVAVGDTFVLKSEAGKEAMGGGHSH